MKPKPKPEKQKHIYCFDNNVTSSYQNNANDVVWDEGHHNLSHLCVCACVRERVCVWVCVCLCKRERKCACVFLVLVNQAKAQCNSFFFPSMCNAKSASLCMFLCVEKIRSNFVDSSPLISLFFWWSLSPTSNRQNYRLFRTHIFRIPGIQEATLICYEQHKS